MKRERQFDSVWANVTVQEAEEKAREYLASYRKHIQAGDDAAARAAWEQYEYWAGEAKKRKRAEQ